MRQRVRVRAWRALRISVLRRADGFVSASHGSSVAFGTLRLATFAAGFAISFGAIGVVIADPAAARRSVRSSGVRSRVSTLRCCWR